MYAVDKNPHAIECLLKSLSINRNLKGTIIPVCTDVADFLDLIRDNYFDRLIMNLPHRAIDYLELVWPKLRLGGIVHLYVLASIEDEVYDKVFNLSLSMFRIKGVKKVLDYAPFKYIYRIDLLKST